MKNLMTFDEFLNEAKEYSQKELETKVQEFLKKYPSGKIPDSDVHKFSEELNINTNELESIFYKFAANYVNEDQVPGGKGDETDENSVDYEELQVGQAVEKEHTDDPQLAKEIALDHLTEDPKYYSKLIKSGIVDEKEALDLAKKFGW